MRNPLPLSAFPQTKKSWFFLAHRSARKPGQRSISFVEGFPCPNPRFHLRKEICGFPPRIFIVTKCGSWRNPSLFPCSRESPVGTFDNTIESSIPMYIPGEGGYPYPPLVKVKSWGYTNSCLITPSESKVDFIYPHLMTTFKTLNDFENFVFEDQPVTITTGQYISIIAY